MISESTQNAVPKTAQGADPNHWFLSYFAMVLTLLTKYGIEARSPRKQTSTSSEDGPTVGRLSFC